MIDSIGKYRILELIGRGGMGAVYKARDPLLKRVVAIKVIADTMTVTDTLRARFFLEARAAANLSHRNIVTVYDLGEDREQLFLVMEYLEGEELKGVIAKGCDLSVEAKLALMIQVCDGLAYAHAKGVVHRDIKPANVFVLPDRTVKILDFGVARIATADVNLTQTGHIMGTLRYMSPEQVSGRVDRRSDMFSAGLVFYELLTSRSPLLGSDPLSILGELSSTASPSLFRPDPTIPEDLAAVVERMLQKDPDARYADMTDVRGALDEVRVRLKGEATELRQRLEGLATVLSELEAALTERLGFDLVLRTSPLPGEGTPVVALEKLQREYEERSARLQRLRERAGAVRDEYEHAMERLNAGEWAAALAGFEHVVEEMPEHAGAQEGLARARAEGLRASEEAARHGRKAARVAAAAGARQREQSGQEGEGPAAPALNEAAGEPLRSTGPRTAIAAPPEQALPPTAPAARMAPRIRLMPLRLRTLALGSVALAIVVALAWLALSFTTSRRLQAEVVQARQRADASRDEAMKAEAPLLARALFDAAVTKDREGQQLAGARRFGPALAPLSEAAARYAEAARAARAARGVRDRADRARAEMLAAKKNAAPETTEFREALAREKEGDDRYGQLAFADAADGFEAAARLFAKALPPPATPASPAPAAGADAKDEIREVLRLYARAFETKDLALLQRVRPALRADELLRHRATFDQVRSYRLILRIDTLTVRGEDAEAKGRREDVVVTGSGDTIRNPGEFRFRLKRVNDRWTIDAVK